MSEALPSPRSFHRTAARAALVVGLTTWATVSTAADIHVPADQPTIQQAIEAAKRGDRVLVSPGVYYEHVHITDKVVDLISTDGAAATTIDGSGTGTAVSIFNRHKARSLVQGFTIAHGNVSGFQKAGGGGISVRGRLVPTIKNNLLEFNASTEGGGAIFVGGSAQAQIERNTFRHNSASEGGAILLSRSDATSIKDNIFEINTAADGGAIYSNQAASLEISRNVMRNNRATDGRGGAIAILGGTSLIAENLIHDNRAGTRTFGGYGAGISINVGGHDGQSANLINNTFARNKARIDELYALVGSGASMQVSNNIFLTTHGRTSISCAAVKLASVTFSHNLAYSTSRAKIEGTCDFAGGGLLTVDPMFVGGDGGHNRS